MKIHHGFRGGQKRAASTLVEIALSLGIIGFALVGIVGTIPLALNTGRLGIAQSRAATVASTIFENFRTQPFNAAVYLDVTTATPSPPTVNLDSLTTAYDPNDKSHTDLNLVKYYAYFDEAPPVATSTSGATPTPTPTDDRHLHFSASTPANGAYYQITLHFNNNPPGTFVPYQTVNLIPIPLRAEANGIEASICESDRPNDIFRFSSVIANRTE